MRRTTSKVIINFLALVMPVIFFLLVRARFSRKSSLGTRRPELTQTLSNPWSMLSAIP